MSARSFVARLAALAGALACGVEAPSPPPAPAVAPEEAREPTHEPSAPASAPAPALEPTAPARAAGPPMPTTPAAPDDSAAPIPLDRLLALPPYRKPDTPDLAELLRRHAAAAPGDSAAASPSRLRFDLHRRTHTPVERSDLKREQVDAGVAVSVGDDTSLRGGVRVQRDTAEAAAPTLDTAPSIGIEKRF
jgi:hypothetical protein